MHRTESLLSVFTIAALAHGQNAQAPYAVPTYATPSSASWPSSSAWNALNYSLSGKLSTVRPWAAVCYASDPLFDESACQSVLASYGSDTARDSHAGALLWTNWETCGFGEGCSLDVKDPQIVYNKTCEQGSIPPYSIEVSDAQEISTVVKWAVRNNVKLVVKNTGHDYLGRSSAPFALQVWTHSMDSITYNTAFVAEGSSSSPVPAVTFEAGAQVDAIYDFLEANNISTVMGGCMTVGAAGGFVQGGGHGPLTPTYGLAADNVLEVEIVTIDGTIRTINEEQDSDLFWAVRGGGAGTYGIVTSVTLAAYPPTSMGASLLTIIPNASLNASELALNWLSFTAQYANEWIENGIAIVNVVSSTGYYLNLYWPTFSTPLSLLYPFFDALLAQSASYTVVANTTSATAFSSVSAAEMESIGPFFDAVNIYGGSTRLASRLIPHTLFTDAQSTQQVAEAIWAGHALLNAPLTSGAPGTEGEVPVLILGDMPAAKRAQAHATGANPGLYKATWHTVYAIPWFAGADEATTAAVERAVHAATGPLTALGVTASYQNEGDAYEADWQKAFFGSKYQDLLSIKQKYDPANFFNNWKGVGFIESLDAWQCFHAGAPQA